MAVREVDLTPVEVLYKDVRMKITKRQLRRIIKEEKGRVLTEKTYAVESRLIRALEDYLNVVSRDHSGSLRDFRSQVDDIVLPSLEME